MDVSFVIPVRNERENIPDLSKEIDEVMSATDWDWECLWVDDGSTDGSLDVMRNLSHDNPRFRYLSFERGRGQSTGMVAGLRVARGKVIVTMDGDGQNDPHDAPKMVKMVLDGDAGAVIGYRARRQDSIVRKISSKIANGFRNWLIGESIRDVGCALRAFRSEYVSNMIAFEGMHRFMPTVLRMNGCTVIETPVNHRPREKGVTKYGIHNRLWVGLLDTFGVRWLMFRRVMYKIAESSDGGNSSGGGEYRNADG